MAGPWEKYQNTTAPAASGPAPITFPDANAAASGPWQKYQGAQAAPATTPPSAPASPYGFIEDMIHGKESDTHRALRVGVANGATLGYAPQIVGAAQALPAAFDPDSSYSDEYGKARDAEIKNENDLKTEHPLAYGAGSIGGAIAAPIPGLAQIKAAEGAGLMAKLGMAGLRGAAVGAVANPGDDPTSSTVGDPQLAQRAKNAGLGFGLGTAAEGATQVLEKAPDTIDSIRRWMTGKQLGANTTQMKQLLKETPTADGSPQMRIDQVEKFMDDNGMLNAGTTFSGVVDKSGDLVDQHGKTIEGIYSGLDHSLHQDPNLELAAAHTAINGPQMAKDFFSAERDRLAKQNGGAAVLSRLKNELGIDAQDTTGTLSNLGPNASMADAHAFRAGVDDQIPWNADPSGKLYAQSMRNLRSFLNQKMQDRVAAVDDLTGGNNLSALKAANQNYANAKTINTIATNTKAREFAKWVPGLTGAMGGGAYGVYSADHGTPLPEAILRGAAVGLGLRASRAIGPALTYRGAAALQPAAQGLAKYLEAHPEVAQKLTVAPWLTMGGGAQ